MADMEVEVMLEGHPHLFVVDVESVLEVESLKGQERKCPVCGFEGTISKVGIPGRKPNRSRRSTNSEQKSIFEE